MNKYFLGKSADTDLKPNEFDTIFIMANTTKFQQRLLNVLPKGQSDARSQKELAALLKCDPRTIASEIQALRRAGNPICSYRKGAHYGYCLPENQQEFDEYMRMLRNSWREMLKTYRMQQFNAYGLSKGNSLPITAQKFKDYIALKDVKEHLND